MDAEEIIARRWALLEAKLDVVLEAFRTIVEHIEQLNAIYVKLLDEEKARQRR